MGCHFAITIVTTSVVMAVVAATQQATAEYVARTYHKTALLVCLNVLQTILTGLVLSNKGLWVLKGASGISTRRACFETEHFF